MIEIPSPVLGEMYRIPSFVDPYFGIGTVVKVNEDGSGILESEESGQISFSLLELMPVETDFRSMFNTAISAILAEIAMHQENRFIPLDVNSFAKLHDYMDANLLVLKHVPREEGDWAASETQSRLDNLIMDRVSKELQKISSL